MTEPTPPEPVQEAPAAVEQQQDEATLPEWARAAITKANREAASYRTQVAELKPKAEQFARLEEASKTELQRLQESAEAARQQAANAQADAVRYKAAAMHGITADHFDLLGSGTEEEITARAQKIADLIAKTAATTTAPTGRPVEQLRAGASPAPAPTDDDVIFEKLFGPLKK